MILKKEQHRQQSGVDNTSFVFIRLEAFKHKVAAYLQRRSEKLSTIVKRYGLALFSLLFGGCSFAIIIYSSVMKDNSPGITELHKLLHTMKHEKPFIHTDSAITRKEYERVMNFKSGLLRLKENRTSHYVFDSINRVRPKLLDSINLFEKIYLSQK